MTVATELELEQRKTWAGARHRRKEVTEQSMPGENLRVNNRSTADDAASLECVSTRFCFLFCDFPRSSHRSPTLTFHRDQPSLGIEWRKVEKKKKRRPRRPFRKQSLCLHTAKLEDTKADLHLCVRGFMQLDEQRGERGRQRDRARCGLVVVGMPVRWAETVGQPKVKSISTQGRRWLTGCLTAAWHSSKFVPFASLPPLEHTWSDRQMWSSLQLIHSLTVSLAFAAAAAAAAAAPRQFAVRPSSACRQRQVWFSRKAIQQVVRRHTVRAPWPI